MSRPGRPATAFRTGVLSKLAWQGLIKNRTRTVVTIVGVVLSAALFSGVTSFIASFQDYLVRSTIAQRGDWQVEFADVDAAFVQKLRSDPKTGQVSLVQNIGYSRLDGGANQFKPYLHVVGYDEQAFRALPIELLDGRLPRNPDELVVSQHIATDGGVRYRIGDTLRLDIGQRQHIGMRLGQNDPVGVDEDGRLLESFAAETTRTFTVVGTCARLNHEFEPYSAPGYTVITTTGSGGAFDAYASMTSLTKEVYKYAEQMAGGHAYEFNYQLLRFTGISNDSFNTVLYGLGAVLIGLIMVGSVLLIYNSFSISVAERSRQFGVLASVGATRAQLSRSVLFEGACVGAVGIPLGVLAGVGGIGVTLKLVAPLFDAFFTAESAGLQLVVSPVALAVAAAVAMTVILVSAYLPARRAARCSAIDAIRQTKDIAITARSVKTSRLTMKLAGLAGALAAKNYKRNKRRYRTTVVSLAVSVVLFVSASAFGMYLQRTSETVIAANDYDVMVRVGDTTTPAQALRIFDELKAAPGVDRGSYWSESVAFAQLPEPMLSERFLRDHRDSVTQSSLGAGGTGTPDTSTEWGLNVWVYFIADADFAAYLSAIGWGGSFTAGDPLPASDQFRGYDREQDRWVAYNLLRDRGTVSLPIQDGFLEVAGLGQAPAVSELSVKMVDGLPAGFRPSSATGLMVFAPYSLVDRYAAQLGPHTSPTLLFWSAQPGLATAEIQRVLDGSELTGHTVTSAAEDEQRQRNILLVVNTFTYGFIVLMALITVAAVFNTVSTNVALRRRELAMLTSVGMSRRRMRQMMLYECALYGVKALMWGLPIAAGVTYLIYQAIFTGVDMRFTLPWASLGISVAGVFLVVFVTMVYSVSKLKTANTADVLTSEIL